MKESPGLLARTSRAVTFFWAMALVGLLLRVMAIHTRPAGAVIIAPDEGDYLQLAQSIAAGDGFSLNGEPTAYRDMLFPAVSGVILRLAGNEPTLVLYLQALLSVGTASLLFLITRRRFSDVVALAIGATWVLYPAAIIFSSLLLTETLAVFLWVLALDFHDRLEEANHAWLMALALGVTLGLLALARAVGILLLAAILIYLLFVRYETPWRARGRAAALIVGGFLLIVLPWMIRNAIAVNRFALNTNAGINLYIGNNPRATGGYQFDEATRAPLLYGSIGEGARDELAANLAREYAREHPREALARWPRKFAFLWSTDMSLWAHYAPDSGAHRLASRLRAEPVGRLFLLAFPYALMVALGTAGFYLVRHFPARGFFILQLALGTLAALVSYGLPRYHFPYMPALLIGAGALWRPCVWESAPIWRRLFLLFTLGMFLGIWLFEAVTIMEG